MYSDDGSGISKGKRDESEAVCGGREGISGMGMYLNLGNDGFRIIRKSIYVDKTGLFAFINGILGTKQKMVCVSRPRRFGKSFAAQMLCAYYDRTCDSKSLFTDLEIERDPSFEKYLNQYDVIYLDITWFIDVCKDIKNIVNFMQEQSPFLWRTRWSAELQAISSFLS